jgi:GDPmannose 4,6-dehydratase
LKKALITGIAGQDGSYLAEFLLKKGYEVHGIIRRESLEDPHHKMVNINNVRDKLILHTGTLGDHLAIYKIIRNVLPDECYHLAASSFVNYSFEDEFMMMNYNFNTTHYILSTLKEVKADCRLFFAGSSEMFGEPDSFPQTEETKFNPKSIYGISKVASSFLIKNYREKENIFACTGIMYNHESPRRGHQFVTRKITSTVAKIKMGLEKQLILGNLDAQRDWGYAPDYIKAMWLILQNDKPEDYILATGQLHSVRNFVNVAFQHVGLNYENFIETDPKFYRRSEKIPLCGNPEKIKRELNWSCDKQLDEIIKEMVDFEINRIQKGEMM